MAAANNNSLNLGNDKSHRHMPHQIQQLELSNLGVFRVKNPSNGVPSRTGVPISCFLPLSPNSFDILLGRGSESSSLGPALMNSQSLLAASGSTVKSEKDKEDLVEKASQALYELIKLSRAIDRDWVRSLVNGGYVFRQGNYSQIFRKSSHMMGTSFRFESSKDSTSVSAKASHLAGMFLDMKQWADLFPTIVSEGRILKAVDTGSIGGSVQLMYGRMHILSPLVAPRESIFLRCCVQPSEETWMIVDIPYDSRSDIQAASPTRSWRFPCGVLIQSLPDAQSKVTWVEHVEVDRSVDHPLYENLLFSSHGYGATRWLYTLRRMIERSQYSVISGSASSHGHEGGMNILEGRANFMTLSLRMIRHFCAILTMPAQLDLSASFNPKIRTSVRNNNEPGQYHGIIVSASTSIWVPYTFETLFNFLRDINRRPEWDLMYNRSSVTEIAHMSTGTHPGNSISIIQPSILKEQNMCLLQENSIDPIGALVIFSLLDLRMIAKITNGVDTSDIPILPCGFLISGDGVPDANGSNEASTSKGTTSRKPSGSLITLVFQLPGMGNPGSAQIAAADTLNTIVTSIIDDLKVALGYS